MPQGFQYRSNRENCQKAIIELAGVPIEKVAFQVEAQTKANIQENGQIDTGFMLNSVYAVTDSGSTYDATDPSGFYMNQGGEGQERSRANQIGLQGADAAVAVAADYAIWQELRRSFLWRSVQSVKGSLR